MEIANVPQAIRAKRGPDVIGLGVAPDGSVYLAQGNYPWFLKVTPGELDWREAKR